MTTDRKTKALLLAIAIGLWANAAAQWLRPKVLYAQNTADIAQDVERIAHHVKLIAEGTCTNSKIC
jgi:hypothetical protein